VEIAKLYITLAADASEYKGQSQQADRDSMSWASDLAGRMSKVVGAAILAAVAAATVAIAGFFVGAVDKAAALEAQMDTVAALLGATAEEAEKLRQATIDLALDPNLKVSATEAAQAIEMLAQNGLTVEEILGGAARATVLLANATGADFTIAARIATDAMALWGMEASDLEQVANGVTAVLVQSKMEVTDYALALAQAGGVASAAGVSFEDFNATLVAIAPYFASGSDAGTSYKTMLQRLIPTTNSAKDAMAALGLITEDGGNAFFDSQGNMRDMAEVAGILNGALGGLSEQQRLQALSTIFGTDAMRAAVAMSQFTEEEFRRLQAVMANTSAAEIAAQRMANFSGAMEIFKGVVEGLQLQLGNVLLPILTKLALEGANLLAAWGPPIIAAFEKAVEAIGLFINTVAAGGEPISALTSLVWYLLEAFGVSRETAEAVTTAFYNIATAVNGIVTPIAQAITSFVSWKDALLAVGVVVAALVLPALLSFLAPIAGIVAAVAGLAVVFGAVRTAWERDFLGIRTAVEGVAQKVGQVVELIGQFIGNLRSGESPLSAITQLIMNVGLAFGLPIERVGELMKGFVSFTDHMQAVFAPAVERIREAFGSLSEAGRNVVEAVQSFVQTLRDGGSVVDAFKAALPLLGEAARNAGQAIVDGLGAAVMAAKAALIEGFDHLKTAIFDWAGATSWGEVGQTIIDKIADFFRGLGDKAASIQADIFNWIANAVDSIDWRAVGEAIIDGIAAAVGAVVGLLVTAGTAIVNYFIGFFTNEEIGPAAENLISSLGNALSDLADGIGDGLASIRDVIFEWAGAEDWGDVAAVIVEMVGDGLAVAADFIGEQLGAWRDAIFDWAGAEDWGGVAEYIAEIVGEQLGEMAASVAERLAAWRDAIFEWAGAESWGEVALVIAEMVGTALADAAGAISERLAAWRDAIFDWVGVENWTEVGQLIVEFVVEGLTEFASEAADALDSWWDAFVDWVEGIDWYQIGYDIAYFVVDGLGEFVTSIKETLTRWYTAFQEATAGMTWDQIAVFILAAVVKGLIDFAASAGTAVDSWWREIDAKLKTMFAAFLELGRSIVGGIIEGIKAMAGAVGEAIRGIIAGALSAGRDEAGSHSPARAFMPLGSDITAGVAVGMLQNVGAVLGAIGQIASQIKTEGVKEFGEAVMAIADAIAAALSASLDIGSFTGPGSGWEAALTAIAEMMGKMVEIVAGANSLGAEALEELAKFVDVAGEIVELFVRVADLGGFLAQWQPPAVNVAVARLELLAGYLAMMVTAVAALDEEATLIVGVMGDFVKTALELPALFGAVGEFTGFLSYWQPPSPAVVVARLELLAGYLAMMVQTVAEANRHGLGGLAILSEFVETAQGVAELFAPLLTAIREIAAFDPPDMGWFVASLKALGEMLHLVVAAVADANLWSGIALEQLGAFVETAGAIAEMILPLVAALLEIDAFGTARLDTFVYGVAQLAYTLRVVVTALAEANTFGSLTLEGVRAFAETGQAIAEMTGPAIEAMHALNQFGGVRLDNFHYGVAQLAYTLRIAAIAFAEANTFGSVALEAVRQFTETGGAIAEMVTPAVEAMGALNKFGTVRLDTFHYGVAQLAYTLRIVVLAFSQANTFGAAVLEQARLFAEAAGDILDVVEDGITTLTALAGYVAATGIQAKAQAFAADLAVTLVAVVNGLKAGGLLANEAVVQAAELADGLKDILDVVGEGVEAIGAVTSYVAASGIQGKAQQFAADLVTVIVAITNALKTAGVLASEAVAEAGEMSDALADIVKVVEPAVEAVVLLVGYTTVGGLKVNAQQFAADLAVVVQTLVDGLRQAGLLANSAVAEAGEMAKSIEDILKVVEPALDPDKGALSLIAKYVSDGGLLAKTQKFTADLIAVMNVLVTGLTTSALASGVALAKAGEMATSMDDLFKAIKPATDTMNDIANYTSAAGLTTKTQQFVNDLTAMATVLVVGLTAAANQLSAAAISAAHAFAQSIGLIASRLLEVVNSLGEIGALPTPDIAPKLAYIVVSAQQIVTAFGAAGDIGRAVDYAETFRANLEQLVKEVQGAVASLAALAGTGTSGSVGAALQAIANALQNTTGQFAGAGLALAAAFVNALVAGINAGVGGVGQTASNLVGAVIVVATNAARGANLVGATLDMAIMAGVMAGQNQVVAAVVAVVGAAVAAGLNEAKKATTVGQQLIQAALAEVNAGRFALDSAGAAAGTALIDGMVRAITAGKSRLVNAIREAVQAAINAAEAALGIASPSRVAFEIFHNFMQTAEVPLSDPRGLVKAIGRSTRAMVEEAARAAQGVARLAIPVIAPPAAAPVTVGAQTRLAQPALGTAAPVMTPRAAAAPAPVYNFYGDFVIEGVQDGPGVLEQLAAITAGARRR
jgi:TP901 family phage tail tape measure protein